MDCAADQVEILRHACAEFSSRGITAATACALFERSPELASGYIEANTPRVVKSAGFLALSEASLCAILRNSKLDIPEVKLFQAVLRWGAAQAERRKLDATKPEVMREVLKQALPLIRFPLFTMQQISEHVTQSGLLTPEQMLGVFSFLGGNKQAKCVFPTARREPLFVRCELLSGGAVCVRGGANQSFAVMQVR